MVFNPVRGEQDTVVGSRTRRRPVDGTPRTHGPAHTGRLRRMHGRSSQDTCHRLKRCAVGRRTSFIEDSEPGSAVPGRGGGKCKRTATTRQKSGGGMPPCKNNPRFFATCRGHKSFDLLERVRCVDPRHKRVKEGAKIRHKASTTVRGAKERSEEDIGGARGNTVA